MALNGSLDGIDLITLSIAVSLVGGALVMIVGRKAPIARTLALLISFVPLAATAYMSASVLTNPIAGYSFQHQYNWINLGPGPGFANGLHINYIVGVDGISAPLSFLTALLVTISILFAWDQENKPGLFHGLLLMMNASVLGVFGTMDLFVFYVFWEFTLVPMFFLIAVWGGPRRKYAAIKFFIYTFAASLVMLLGFMALYFVGGTGSFAYSDILNAAAQGKYSQAFQTVVFLALFVGFAVKFPVFPFHTWLPDAHVEAPTSGSVLLAGVLLKMGAYGLLRIAFPMQPWGAAHYVPLMLVIGIVSVLYAAIICLSQTDYKRMVAYSSIGSMGLVLLGLASMTPIGVVGAVFMMLAHGFSSPLMFMMCGVLQHNVGTREIPLMGGLASKMPNAASFIMAGSMAGVGLPGLALFPAEFQIFAGIWERWGILVFIPMLYLMLSAGYWLWAMQRSLFGNLTKKIDLHHVYDLHAFEAIALSLCVVGLVVLGFWPRLLTDPAVQSVDLILNIMGVR
ncbi:MAG: complex I subunit 4 family protein [Thermoplasmatota archaeon]